MTCGATEKAILSQKELSDDLLFTRLRPNRANTKSPKPSLSATPQFAAPLHENCNRQALHLSTPGFSPNILFDVRPMPKLLLITFFSIVLWVAISIAMMWPPVCRYGGKDAIRGYQAVYCINNLRQIDGAKQQFALETGRRNGPVDAAQLERGYFGSKPPRCSSGGIYFYGDIGQVPVCSLSTNPAPRPVKERLGPFFWQWKIRPTLGPAEHKLRTP
jgi:hypothetical protein